jgi:hypothetical protein
MPMLVMLTFPIVRSSPRRTRFSARIGAALGSAAGAQVIELRNRVETAIQA